MISNARYSLLRRKGQDVEDGRITPVEGNTHTEILITYYERDAILDLINYYERDAILEVAKVASDACRQNN